MRAQQWPNFQLTGALADFGCSGGGGGGMSESIKKENLWRKSFFLLMLNEVLKICEK